ncbi:MAG: CDP-alcohol phosphatidyltransferase family protein, partial [bacterium]|nr:CDP-alcohol phosphatidyltransferase family protein [bacterium]
QKLRGFVFYPILWLLNALGISAIFITNLRLVLGIVFLWWFWRDQYAAAIFMVFVIFLDTIDGALARFQGTTSDRGKFLDIVVDHCIYVFILFTFPTLGALMPLVFYNLFITIVAYLLGAVSKGEARPSDWLIKPAPQLSYLKAVIVIPFFLLVLWDINWLNEALWLANILATVLGVYYFITLQRRWKFV